MAGVALIFGANEFSYRLPAVLFGLLAIVLTYLYARRFMSMPLAAAVATAVLLSSWEVEFSRFARMYTIFQCTMLLFLLALDDALTKPEWWRRYLPHLALVLAVLSHELAVLLAPLLLLPLLFPGTAASAEPPGRAWIYGALSLLIVLACLAFTQVDLRGSGVALPALPPDYEPPLKLRSILRVPAFPFWHFPGDPWTTLLLLFAVGFVLTVTLLALRRHGWPITDADIGAALVLLCSLAHLFVLAGMVLLVLLLRYDVYLVRRHPPRIYLLLALAALIACGWVTLALVEPERLYVPAVTLRWDVSEGGLYKALWTTFFGWPDFYPGLLRPFALELPMLGLLTIAALGIVLVMHRHAPLSELVRHPAFIIIYTVFQFGVLRADWSTTRYWFPLYPVILCLIALATMELADRYLGRKSGVGGDAGLPRGVCRDVRLQPASPRQRR